MLFLRSVNQKKFSAEMGQVNVELESYISPRISG